MISLRRTALIWMTALMAAVGLLSYALAYELGRREAADFLDGQLRQIALNAGDSPALAAPDPQKHDPEDEFVIEIWTPDGALVRRSPGDEVVPRAHKAGFSYVRSKDSGEDGAADWRVYQARDGRRIVQVSQSISVRQEMAAASALQAGAPILVLIPLTWLVMLLAIGRMTQRLRALAGEIAARSLSSRDPVPLEGAPVEARPLVEGMNKLTGRLQDALERQKRFVADAAHELRTPLTALQLQLDELDARGAPDAAAPIARMKRGLRRARRLVEQLLRLARSDDDAPAQRFDRIDLAQLVTQCVADHLPIAEERGVDLGIEVDEDVSINGLAGELALLFGNLVDNAVRYTPRGGVVDVRVARTGDRFVVEVADTGPGVADADISRLFDRFFRAAPPDVEGSGLGLAIAAAVARRHEFSILIKNRPPDTRGLLARVEGPLSGV